jgi:hypothetical protein
MARYKKKAGVIEAWRVTPLLAAANAGVPAFLPPPLQEAYERGHLGFRPGCIDVWTRKGTMVADQEDWIIKGVKGEFYPCKPDIFEATYELAENGD